MRSQFDAHHSEIRFARSIHPISRMIHETGTFDPHTLKNPEVLKKNALYQQGLDYGYENSKAFLLSRDGYKSRDDRKTAASTFTLECGDLKADPANLRASSWFAKLVMTRYRLGAVEAQIFCALHPRHS